MKYSVFLFFVALYWSDFKGATTFLTNRILFEKADNNEQRFYEHEPPKEKRGGWTKRESKNLHYSTNDNKKEETHLKGHTYLNELPSMYNNNEYEDIRKTNRKSKKKNKETQNSQKVNKKHPKNKRSIHYDEHSIGQVNGVKNKIKEYTGIDNKMKHRKEDEIRTQKDLIYEDVKWDKGNNENDRIDKHNYEPDNVNNEYVNSEIGKEKKIRKKWRNHVADNGSNHMLYTNLDTLENTENVTPNYKIIEEIKKRFHKERFLFDELKKIDYSEHGKNWDIGKCKIGKFQSPVDLHTKGLKERDLKNITDIYLNVFNEDEYLWNAHNKPWFRGDIFYYYEHLIKQIIINKKDNVFQIKAANDTNIPFGVLFTTDTPRMFYADQIHFHSPSEHTFQGSGNRREIEMQIFHYTNDLFPYEEDEEDELETRTRNEHESEDNNINNVTNNRKEKGKGNNILKNMKTKSNFEYDKKMKSTFNIRRSNLDSYFFSFLKNSISNPQLEKKYMMDSKNQKSKSCYEVLSITFTSAEIDKTTLEMFQKLPSERFLRTILKASKKVLVGSDPQLMDLEEPLNLDALMMMLNVENMQFLSYHGSSTVPSCDENIHWKVAKQALPVSTELIFEFYKMLNDHTPDFDGSDSGNYRQLQNVKDNAKNLGKLYLIQGFPLQVLISSALSTANDHEMIDLIKDVSMNSVGCQLENYFDINIYFFLLAIIFLF